MFEKEHQRVVSRKKFLVRMARSAGLTIVVVAFSLFLGAAGYHHFAGLAWIDALLNASMILTGMGPVDPLKTDEAKLFATFYALYSGIAFLTMTAILMAPLLHRLLHSFHAEVSESDDAPAHRKPTKSGSRGKS
jgi:hypothetical protein